MTVQATPGGSRPYLGWGSVVAGLPSPIGGAPPVHGELGRAAGLIRDTALVGAGFLCLMLSTQVALPQTAVTYETTLLLPAALAVAGLLGLFRGMIAALLWGGWEFFVEAHLWEEVLRNFAVGPRLPAEIRPLLRAGWFDWGQLGTIAGVLLLVAIVGFASDLTLDRQPLIFGAAAIGAVGIAKVIAAVSFTVGLGRAELFLDPETSWSVSLWVILGGHAPWLLGCALLCTGVLLLLRRVLPGPLNRGRSGTHGAV